MLKLADVRIPCADGRRKKTFWPKCVKTFSLTFAARGGARAAGALTRVVQFAEIKNKLLD